MKKRMGTALLCTLLCFSGGVQAFAQEGIEEVKVFEQTEGGVDDYIITPRFANIYSIEYSTKLSSDGKASYSVDVDTASSTKISVYMELQKKSGSSWIVVKNFSQTKNGSDALFSDSTYVDTSGEYRVYYKITAYYGSGQSETVTQYKYM